MNPKLIIRLAAACSVCASIGIEITVRTFDLWTVIAHCDKIMHLLWGLNIFLILCIGLKWRFKDALFGVLGWQLIWEFSEMIGDRLIIQPDYMHDHFHFDGALDTGLDLAGAIIGWLLLKGRVDQTSARRIFPDGSFTLVATCMAIITAGGPAAARLTGIPEDPVAMAGILLTMFVYLVFLLSTHGRLGSLRALCWSGATPVAEPNSVLPLLPKP